MLREIWDCLLGGRNREKKRCLFCSLMPKMTDSLSQAHSFRIYGLSLSFLGTVRFMSFSRNVLAQNDRNIYRSGRFPHRVTSEYLYYIQIIDLTVVGTGAYVLLISPYFLVRRQSIQHIFMSLPL